jgi:hypothetical protein
MKQKNKEKYIYLSGLDSIDENLKEETFNFLFNSLSYFEKIDNKYVYLTEMEESEDILKYILDPTFGIGIHITDTEETINDEYLFVDENGEVKYPDYEHSTFEMFPLYLSSCYEVLEKKIDEEGDEYCVFKVEYYLNNYAIDYLKDIKTLLKYKKDEDLKLYKKITS